MANVNTAGGARALPRPPKRPPTPVTNALAGQQGGGAKAPAVQTPSLVDLSQDPILQQIDAANLTNVQRAQANELAGRKQALIDYGSEPGLEGLFPDQSTQAAAQGNPFSTLANLLYAHQQDTHGIDENLNQRNLFYSSERNRQLSDEEHNYQHGRSDAYGGLSTKLAGIGAALLAAQGAAASSHQQGLSDAFARYTPPTSVASAPQGGPPGPGLGHPFSVPTPALPTFDPSQTTVPKFDPSQTSVPTFQAPTVPQPPKFDPSQTTLPKYKGGALLNALTNSAPRLGGPH